MMRLTKYLIVHLMAITFPAALFAQADIHFSQFYETSILRNPALTGVFSSDYKAGAYYRNQWSSISNPYITTSGYAEVRISVGRTSDDYLSMGLLGYSDKAGSIDQKITAFYPAINYNKCINPDKNKYLSVGFTGGYNQFSFDQSKATFNNQYLNGIFDPINPTLENITNVKMTMWDLGAGINYNTTAGEYKNVTYVVGISGYHLTQPIFSYEGAPGLTQSMRWNVNGAMAFNITENVSTQMHTNFAMQGAYFEQITGALFTWGEAGGGDNPAYAITGGVFYRFQDAIITVAKVKFKKCSIGCSYDVNVSKLKKASNLRGGYELTFALTGDFYDKSGILRKTVCPKF